MGVSRLFSLALVGVDFLVLSTLDKPKPDLGHLLLSYFLPLCIPVLLIWFGDEIGSYIGPFSRGGYVNTPTPGWLLAGFGWILLLVPIGAWVLGFAPEHEHARLRTLLPGTFIGTPIPSPSPSGQIPREVTLATPIQMPVSIRGMSAGTVTIPRGFRIQLVSAGTDSVTVRFGESTATIPASATDLNLASQEQNPSIRQNQAAAR